MKLIQAVRYGMLPTPIASDSKRMRPAPRDYARNTPAMSAAVTTIEGDSGGYLNPQFVEWVMGFPQGWTKTESKPSETQ